MWQGLKLVSRGYLAHNTPWLDFLKQRAQSQTQRQISLSILDASQEFMVIKLGVSQDKQLEAIQGGVIQRKGDHISAVLTCLIHGRACTKEQMDVNVRVHCNGCWISIKLWPIHKPISLSCILPN